MASKRKRFSDITVFEDGPDIYARNKDWRVLFRYNKIDGRISFFRSPRMTDEEKDFCLLMFDKYDSKFNDMKREDVIKALNYQIDHDLYCT